MHNTETKQGQWVADISVKETGSIETIFDFALLSNISITDSLEAGSSISYTDITDKRIVNYYQQNSITPATSIIDSRQQGGIGYMAVGIDFIIS